MSIEQFEARYKKARAEVEKALEQHNKEFRKYQAEGCVDNTRYIAALERHVAANEAMYKINIERRDKLDDAARLLHHYEVELQKARSFASTCEESLARKQAEYNRLLLMRGFN
jgi:hypothetical protein